MPSVLILFAHPALEKSRVHRAMLDAVPTRAGITLHDLYEAYPDLDVDVVREQALLEAHDVVVLQFPFYWYSTPPMLKQWQDLVLEHGWAYGATGTRLAGKTLLCALSAGGPQHAYRPEGYNRFTVRQLLAPIEQTATLCRMRYVAPFVVHGTHRLEPAEVAREAARYGRLLDRLQAGALALDAAASLDALDPLLADGMPEVPNGSAAPDAARAPAAPAVYPPLAPRALAAEGT